jgi:cytochrome c peroxidase
MVAQALSEFQLSLTFADAPLDKFARGDIQAMTISQKRGAVLFFGKAQCVTCHSVRGNSNEMFSDFKMYNIGVPQIAPKFGKGLGNVPFRNANGEFVVSGKYDFGLEDISGKSEDRFKFRTTPLRNLHLAPTFFHNGSFTKLEDAVRHHLDPVASAKTYDTKKAGVEADLYKADPAPVLATLDPAMRKKVKLTEAEFKDLIEFLRNGLADSNATSDKLSKLIPTSVPSGLPLQKFEPPRAQKIP